MTIQGFIVIGYDGNGYDMNIIALLMVMGFGCRNDGDAYAFCTFTFIFTQNHHLTSGMTNLPLPTGKNRAFTDTRCDDVIETSLLIGLGGSFGGMKDDNES